MTPYDLIRNWPWCPKYGRQVNPKCKKCKRKPEGCPVKEKK